MADPTILAKYKERGGALWGTPLMLLAEGAKEGNLAYIQYALEQGVSVNSQIGRTYDTALTLAAQYNQFDAVKYLVQRGADVNAVVLAGTYKDTALSNATRQRNLEMVNFLIANNANVNHRLDNTWAILDMLRPELRPADVAVYNALVQAGAKTRAELKAIGQ